MSAPSALIHLYSLEVGSGCYSASHTEDGSVLIGTHEGVKSLNRQNKSLSNTTSPSTTVTDLTARRKNFYILHRSRGVCKLDICLADNLTLKHQLLEFNRTTEKAASLAVSSDFAVVTNPESTGLYVYDFKEKQTRVIETDLELRGVHFTSDKHLLATSEKFVVKYRMEGERLKEIWRCNDVNEAFGICPSSDGKTIFVCSKNSRSIYIISAHTGKTMWIFLSFSASYRVQVYCNSSTPIIDPQYMSSKPQPYCDLSIGYLLIHILLSCHLSPLQSKMLSTV